MNKKCIGCGAILQTTSPEKIGYVQKANLEKSSLCQRCFRIRNYGDYKVVVKDNQDYINILNDVNKTQDLVVLVVDVFNINNYLNELSKIISNPIILVLSKRDVFPKSIYEEKLLNYMEQFNLNIIDKIFISSNKNYNLDILYDMINHYKKSKDVYIVGQSNSGKSTLINKLLYNYSDNKTVITTSMLPSTTLDTIRIDLDANVTLIDTPGLLDDGNIVNIVSGNNLKKIVPSKEIKPITYQVKTKQYILIDNYAYLEFDDPTNVTLFLSDKLNVERLFLYKGNSKFIKHTFKVKKGQDIVISGLCFIKVSKEATINIYVLNGVNVYIRPSLI